MIAPVQMLALAAALAASGITEPARVNVDLDRAWERLVPQVVKDEFDFEQRRVVLEDNCGRLRLLKAHDSIARMEARELDGVTPRHEIVVEGRSGAAARYGTTRVLRLDGCRVRELFANGTDRPAFRPPRGWYQATYGVRVKRGTVVLDEYLARNGQPEVTASRRRTSRWTYRDGRFRRDSVRFGRA